MALFKGVSQYNVVCLLVQGADFSHNVFTPYARTLSQQSGDRDEFQPEIPLKVLKLLNPDQFTIVLLTIPATVV